MNPPTTVNLICRFAEWRRLRGFAPQFFMSLTRRVCLTPFFYRGDSWMVQMSRVPIATRLSLFNCNRDNRRMPILRQTLPSAWIRHFEQPFAFHPHNPFLFLCAIHFQLYSQAHAKDRSLSMQIRRLEREMNPIVRFWSSMRATTSHDADQFTCHPEEHSILTHMKLRFLLIVNKKNRVGSTSWWFTV